MSAPPTPTPSSNTGNRTYIHWEKDGVNEGPSSMDVLLDWLTTANNYARWRGDSSGGITKDALCKEILEKLAATGLRHRNKNQVRSKMKDLQQAYNKARDWLACTGQGLLDNAKEGENVQATIQGMLYST
jgi:hypothetical protein